MPKKLESCEYRVVMPRGQLNICRAGVYGGKVTDGMCRLCLMRGDKPAGFVQLPRVDVGRAVERVLTAVGITKERVQAWTRLKDCGCKRRAAWLSAWGFRQQDRIERFINRAARWCGIS